MDLGATYLGNGCSEFLLWAPQAQSVELHLLSPKERLAAMAPLKFGYHTCQVEASPGSSYVFRLNGKQERPDPASRFQPEGVHGPSQVVDPHFAWDDGCWFGLPLRCYIIYEIHVGTFTAQGTFDAIIPRLQYLKDLGITAVELMPVAQFPGGRNWGYDGVYPFAVQGSYGGPQGLKKLVNACHRKGLAVVLDVVYNHLGPEGNYLADFGPYFTDGYRIAWGPAINFDGPQSDEVRRFFIENALYWLTEFHFDALRIDAIHGIRDFSAQPFLAELATAVRREAERLNRRLHLFAESDLNDARAMRSQELGGYGLDAQWNDDFHHAIHALLTGEQAGYYQDFGRLEDVVKAFTEGFVYSGGYSAYRQRRHGNSSRDVPASRFVVFAQNHDQVGNRKLGERLSTLVPFQGLKMAAGLVLLSPFIPLLFMGEEYGETTPFLYFVSHTDPGLAEAVRKGREEESAGFAWEGGIPDPNDEKTFHDSRLRRELRRRKQGRVLAAFYRELLQLRKSLLALVCLDREHAEVAAYDRILYLRRWGEGDQVFAAFNFDDAPAQTSLPLPPGRWRKRLDSSETRWLGSGSSTPDTLESPCNIVLPLSARSFVLFEQIDGEQDYPFSVV
ncbi:MAG: malto-oligosyltrehalose trehalohydrolase [Chloroflexi bacterium]|nr:malto-oligosyltrehalose trehalohydrolase [Chloroflexota bacterium]